MKIVAPIDGSSSADVVLDVLLGQAWPPGTKITLLCVVKKGASPAEATRILDEKALLLRDNLPVCQVSTEIVQGDPKAQIIEATKTFSSDLVVMGTRGRKGLELLLGSVSQGVLMQSTCPVLIAKVNSDVSQSVIREGFKSVVVAIDNSLFSRAAVDWMTKVSWGQNTTFKLVAAIQPLAELFAGEVNPSLIKGLTAEQAALFGSAKDELRRMSMKLANALGDRSRITTEVGEGDPREFILRSAAAVSADLIVVGSHGKTGLTKLLLGSVSQAVALHASCSVVVIKGLVSKGQSSPLRHTGQFTKPQ